VRQEGSKVHRHRHSVPDIRHFVLEYTTREGELPVQHLQKRRHAGIFGMVVDTEWSPQDAKDSHHRSTQREKFSYLSSDPGLHETFSQQAAEEHRRVIERHLLEVEGQAEVDAA
jgi:hypothetical protein